MRIRHHVVVCAAVTFLFTVCISADAQTPPPKLDPAAVERGQATFTSACGFCHGSNGKGGEKGPDLLRSVLVLHDEGGNNIGPVILHGRPGKGMPSFPFSPQQITDIVSFLHNSIEATKDRDSYKILNIVTGDRAAGETYFNGDGHCESCHSVTGDLKGIGAKYDAVTLQGKMLRPDFEWTEGNPPQKVAAISVKVTLPSGQTYTGTPTNVDDFTVSLREPGGEYRSFTRNGNSPRVEIMNRLQAHLDLLTQMSDSDIHNLTAYLVTLK